MELRRAAYPQIPPAECAAPQRQNKRLEAFDRPGGNRSILLRRVTHPSGEAFHSSRGVFFSGGSTNRPLRRKFGGSQLAACVILLSRERSGPLCYPTIVRERTASYVDRVVVQNPSGSTCCKTNRAASLCRCHTPDPDPNTDPYTIYS